MGLIYKNIYRYIHVENVSKMQRKTECVGQHVNILYISI